MAKHLDWFSRAEAGWKMEAQRRFTIVLQEHGREANAYIEKRIARSAWGSFERRRWRYIRALLKQKQPLAT
jgi:hypothetical protein